MDERNTMNDAPNGITEENAAAENGETNENTAKAEEAEAGKDIKEDQADKEEREKTDPDKHGVTGTTLGLLLDVLELVAVSLGVVMLLLTFVLRHSPVNGQSMAPTIEGRDGDSAPYKDVLLISDLFYTPETGDIVVIQTPTLYGSVADSLGHAIVKRVIATGGDTLTIDFENWRLTVNDKVIEDGFGSADYVNYPKYDDGNYRVGSMTMMDTGTIESTGGKVTKVGPFVYSIEIPEGKLFVMGDNRNNSKDSRIIGLIDERWVVGRALLRIYPFDRIGTVD